MRFSHYNILSNETKDGEYVLLNSFSGLMDVIDKEAYDVISSYAEAESLPSDVIESLSAIKDQFLERGYLTDLSYEEEIAKAKRKAQELLEKYLSKDWEITIAPSLACNYRCTYCFEKGAGYPTESMNKSQVDAIFEVIKDKVGTGEKITLYGGEPLTKDNREIIEYIVAKGKATGRTFFAVTNGHDLDHYIDLLGSDKISTLQITLDGPKEIHDKRRITLDHSSSYEKIVHNIGMVLSETDATINLRINLDTRNAPFVLEMLEDMEKQGILNHQHVQTALSPVIGIGNLGVTNDDIRRVQTEIEERFPQLKDNLFNRTRSQNVSILSPLYFGEKIPLNVAGCAAAGISKVFAPNGEIYSCWSCMGQPEQVIGTLNDNGDISWNKSVLEKWKNFSLAYNEECLRCKYAFLCGGGCRRPALPGEVSAYSYDCDYYNDLFGDYLASVVEHI